MADADAALHDLESALTNLRGRVPHSDRRRDEVALLKLMVASKFGGTASSEEISEIESATGAVAKLLGQGDFAAVMSRAENAADAVRKT